MDAMEGTRLQSTPTLTEPPRWRKEEEEEEEEEKGTDQPVGRLLAPPTASEPDHNPPASRDLKSVGPPPPPAMHPSSPSPLSTLQFPPQFPPALPHLALPARLSAPPPSSPAPHPSSPARLSAPHPSSPARLSAPPPSCPLPPVAEFLSQSLHQSRGRLPRRGLPPSPSPIADPSTLHHLCCCFQWCSRDGELPSAAPARTRIYLGRPPRAAAPPASVSSTLATSWTSSSSPFPSSCCLCRPLPLPARSSTLALSLLHCILVLGEMEGGCWVRWWQGNKKQDEIILTQQASPVINGERATK